MKLASPHQLSPLNVLLHHNLLRARSLLWFKLGRLVVVVVVAAVLLWSATTTTTDAVVVARMPGLLNGSR